MTKILAILQLLVQWADRWLRSKDQQQAQQQRDELEQDPKGWFDRHFRGSDSRNRVQSDATTQSPKTNQADAGDGVG